MKFRGFERTRKFAISICKTLLGSILLSLIMSFCFGVMPYLGGRPVAELEIFLSLFVKFFQYTGVISVALLTFIIIIILTIDIICSSFKKGNEKC